jgi:hypothetical protein
LHVGTFIPIQYCSDSGKRIPKKRKRVTKEPVNAGNLKPLYGIAYKKHDKHMNFEYKRHVAAAGKKEALDRAHWDEVYNHPPGIERERALRRLSRGTHYRDQYFLENVSSVEKAEQLEAVTNALCYLFYRANNLKKFIDYHVTTALVKGTPDKYLVRASFDGDLPAEKDTDKSTSKAQLCSTSYR